MDIYQLRYFIAVVELGSFSRAAAHCHISQSALSEQIHNLEIRLGKTLLIRNHRQTVPTEIGLVLVRDAKAILAQIENTKEKIRTHGESNFGDVTFGILPTIAPFLLPHFLDSFITHNPKTQMIVRECLTGQSLELIEAGKLDFGIVSLPVREQGFDTEILFAEEMLLAVHPQHPLSQQPTISPRDLHSEKFILMQEEHCLGEQVIEFCQQQDFRPQIVMRCCQLATVQSLVAMDMGISLIPNMAIAEPTTQITYRQLENPRPKRTIAIVTRKKRPLKLAAQYFFNHLRLVGKTFKLPAINHLPSPSSEKPQA